MTIERQLIGLEQLQVSGRTVLDVGCAEGLIGEWCLKQGAYLVRGVELRLDYAKQAAKRLNSVVVADADSYEFGEAHDVVLALGVLNKLARPASSLRRMLAACKEVCVLRLSAGQWPVMRTDRAPEGADLAAAALKAGFTTAEVCDGPVDPGTGPQVVVYLTRCAR